MRIAQIAPLLTPIAPMDIGPQAMIGYLTNALVDLGHDVTLFATANSQTRAKLIPTWPQPVPYEWPVWVVSHLLMVEQVYEQAQNFDIIHNHVECLVAPIARRNTTPTLSTLHVPIVPNGWLAQIYQEYRELPHVAISEFQRREMAPWLNWRSVIPYGLPPDAFSFHEAEVSCLIYLNRTSSYQGLAEAVEIANRVGMRLTVEVVPPYFAGMQIDEQTATLLNHPFVDTIEATDDEATRELLSNALALIVPSACDAPIAYPAIAALACGTPILGRKCGSVSELVEDGITGFLFETIDDAVAAIHKLGSINRKRCRKVFEERFSLQRMVNGYLEMYEQLTHQAAM